MDNLLPLSYRWFIAKGLTKWQPWYFMDTIETIKCEPNLRASDLFRQFFLDETGADFDVYLFARRQDCDDFAFFLVRDGKVEDKVVSLDLDLWGGWRLSPPLRYANIEQTFLNWIREVVMVDIERDWMMEADLFED